MFPFRGNPSRSFVVDTYWSTSLKRQLALTICLAFVGVVRFEALSAHASEDMLAGADLGEHRDRHAKTVFG